MRRSLPVSARRGATGWLGALAPSATSLSGPPGMGPPAVPFATSTPHGLVSGSRPSGGGPVRGLPSQRPLRPHPACHVAPRPVPLLLTARPVRNVQVSPRRVPPRTFAAPHRGDGPRGRLRGPRPGVFGCPRCVRRLVAVTAAARFGGPCRPVGGASLWGGSGLGWVWAAARSGWGWSPPPAGGGGGGGGAYAGGSYPRTPVAPHGRGSSLPTLLWRARGVGGSRRWRLSLLYFLRY